jgi:hypothetical protein
MAVSSSHLSVYFITSLRQAALYSSMVIFLPISSLVIPNVFSTANSIGSPMFKLFEKLPDEFTREQALVIGAALAQKPRTVDKYLALLFPKYLEKSKPGFYRKTQSGIN